MDHPGALATPFTQDEDKQSKKAITQYKKKDETQYHVKNFKNNFPHVIKGRYLIIAIYMV